MRYDSKTMRRVQVNPFILLEEREKKKKKGGFKTRMRMKRVKIYMANHFLTETHAVRIQHSHASRHP